MARLARDGGMPVFTGEFPRWPQWGEQERQNLLEALDAGQWGTLGKKTLGFAGRFAKYIGVKHAIAVNTGTQALELMLAKNHDYGEAWRSMRISSYTDLILMKVFRTKQIEDLGGATLVSEGIAANYMDMVNYAVFALIKLTLEQGEAATAEQG